LAHSYRVLGLVQFRARKFVKAKKSLNTAIPIFKSLSDKSGLASIYLKIGDIHLRQYSFLKSIESYNKALNFCEQFNCDFKDIILLNLSNLYIKIEYFENAIEHLKLVRENFRRDKNAYNHIIADINLSSALIHLGKSDEAVGVLNEALSIANPLKMDYLKCYIYTNFIEIFLKKNKITTAQVYYKILHKKYVNFKFKDIKVFVLFTKAKILFAKKKFRKVVNILTPLYKNSIRLNDSYSMRNLLEFLYKAHKELGNKGKTLKYFELYHEQVLNILEVNKYVLKSRSYEFANKEKEFYNELKISNEQKFTLKKLVDERTQKLTVKNNELSQFAHSVSHDIKGPILNCIGFANIIEGCAKSHNFQKLPNYIEAMKKSANLSLQIINDTLEFTKIDDGNNKEEVKINLIQIINDITINISGLYKNKKRIIRIENVLPELNGHKTYYYLLFKNIIENGLKYNTSKIARVTVSYQKTQMHHIKIIDNGIGIKKQHQELIFLMYKRYDEGKISSGTGLGLAICKKIVEKLNGKIWVDSLIGKGSTFNITLPIENG